MDQKSKPDNLETKPKPNEVQPEPTYMKGNVKIKTKVDEIHPLGNKTKARKKIKKQKPTQDPAQPEICHPVYLDPKKDYLMLPTFIPDNFPIPFYPNDVLNLQISTGLKRNFCFADPRAFPGARWSSIQQSVVTSNPMEGSYLYVGPARPQNRRGV